MDRLSSRFSANTAKNPKEECKAIMTRSRMAIQADEGRAKEKVEGYKQQSTAEPTLELVSDFVELEEILDDEDDQERETQIKDSQEGIKMKEGQEKEKEIKEKEKEKDQKKEKEKEKVDEEKKRARVRLCERRRKRLLLLKARKYHTLWYLPGKTRKDTWSDFLTSSRNWKLLCL